MKLWIGLIIAFAVLVFVYNFIKNKKRRKAHVDMVAEFNKRYHKVKKVKKSEHKEYSNYITKYNSSLDYVEKSEIASDKLG